MAKQIDFYFDFVSPYGYIGAVGVEHLADRIACTVNWCPMLLGVSVLKVMKLPAVPDTPLKGAYAAHDWPRFARRMGLINAPHANTRFSSLAAMRLFVWIAGRDPALAKKFAMTVYRAHWGEGREMSAPHAIADEAARLGFAKDDCLTAMEDPKVKQQLREAVDAALALGVFGCPTFVVDGELFWGADRLDQVEEWATTGGW